MKYDDRIRSQRNNMSKSFAKLADFLLDSYVEAAFMTASELAQNLKLDAATVVRFSQYLGYDGYPQLLSEIRDRVKTDLLRRPLESKILESTPNIAQKAMKELALAIDHTRISLNTVALDHLIEKIDKARRIIILAEGPAQPNAYSLVQCLEQGGYPVYIARSGVADLARTINTTTDKDLIIGVEVVGQSPYITQALNQAQKKGIPTATIIGAASLASARSADIVIAAQTNISPGIGVVSVEAIIYTLSQLLQYRYPKRFAGTEQAIASLTTQIQQPLP